MSAPARKGTSKVQGAWAKGVSKPFVTGVSTASHSRTNDAQSVANLRIQGSVVYSESLLQYKEKPVDIVIREAGEHILDKTEHESSRISFYPNFLTEVDADSAFASLSNEVAFVQNSDKYGPQPRLTAWFGQHPYSYSGLTHQINLKMPATLHTIMDMVSRVTGHTFNSVLCNLYRDNHDSVDWHSDNEPMLGENPYIASVSLGDARTFELRQNPPDAQSKDYSLCQHVKIVLPHGSLLVMEGATQNHWQHRIPKEYHDRSPRINLTFRTVLPN